MNRKNNFTKKEIDEIMSKPFKIFPEPANGVPYGPQPQQLPVFEIGHTHPVTIDLVQGGGRGGKTASVAARGIEYLLKYPGCTIIIGAENMPLIDRTIKLEYQKRFSIHEPWDHPLVKKFPTDKRQELILKNGSRALFIHFSEFKKLRGTEAVFIHIEEASLIKDADAMEELQRRLSGKEAPVRQLILTTNPEEQIGWIYDTFSLKQNQPGYDGPRLPIQKPCKCQFCQECLKNGKDVELVERVCPDCGATKRNNCAGNQEFFRVIMINPKDNMNLPPEYYQSVKSGTSEEKFALYTEGQVIELRQGFIYKNFSPRVNIYAEDIPLDYEKEMHWYFDINISYQCSVIVQTRKTATGIKVDVIDEVVVPEAGPEMVARHFLRKYKDYDQVIKIDGDPSGLNRKTGPEDSTHFQIIYNILTNPALAGDEFKDYTPKKVEMLAKKVKGATKIAVLARVDATNQLLRDGEGNITLKVNPSCRYLIRSLEAMRWKEGGQTAQMDVQCDKNAAKSANKRTIHLLSHPTDALGYYVYKNFPVIKPGHSPIFAMVPGENTLYIEGNDVKETSTKQKREKKDPLDDLYAPIEPLPSTSFTDFLGLQFGNAEDADFYTQDLYW